MTAKIKPENKKMKRIYCCGCKKKVKAILTTALEAKVGKTNKAIWYCEQCASYVGTHAKANKNKTRPLGTLATLEMRSARMHIHALLDPIWKEGHYKRRELYQLISDFMGWQYHTAKLKNIEDGRKVYRFLLNLKKLQNIA